MWMVIELPCNGLVDLKKKKKKKKIQLDKGNARDATFLTTADVVCYDWSNLAFTHIHY